MIKSIHCKTDEVNNQNWITSINYEEFSCGPLRYAQISMTHLNNNVVEKYNFIERIDEEKQGVSCINHLLKGVAVTINEINN